MPSIDLTDQEIVTLMFILANAEFKNGVTWSMINPLVMKIGEQARRKSEQARREAFTGEIMRPPPPHEMRPFNSGEATDEQR